MQFLCCLYTSLDSSWEQIKATVVWLQEWLNAVHTMCMCSVVCVCLCAWDKKGTIATTFPTIAAKKLDKVSFGTGFFLFTNFNKQKKGSQSNPRSYTLYTTGFDSSRSSKGSALIYSAKMEFRQFALLVRPNWFV